MGAITEPVTNWWRAFSVLVSDFYTTMGPREYGYILIITGIVGYFFLKSGAR